MKITIVGTGNVAFHLGERFIEKDIIINEVVGRDAAKTAWLSEILNAKPTSFDKEIDKLSDVYIIAVSDSAIGDAAEKLCKYIDNQWVVHTSGSISSTVLEPYFKKFGVFYPLQTFSMDSKPNFNEIPIFINTPPQYSIDFLKNLAEKISSRVYVLSDDDRMTLHVAAVFVNNFTNHLFKIGSEIVAKQNLPFDVLRPLIEETVNKIRENTPLSMQTGPAKRGDDVTVEKHLSFLEKNNPQYDLLYTLLSISINPNLKINK